MSGKVLQNVFVIFNLVLVLLLPHHFREFRHGYPGSPSGLAYQDFICVVLTALAVMLAVLPIILALVAIWGYNALKEEAQKIARKVAIREARKVAKTTAEEVARVYMASVADTTSQGSSDANRYVDAKGGQS